MPDCQSAVGLTNGQVFTSRIPGKRPDGPSFGPECKHMLARRPVPDRNSIQLRERGKPFSVGAQGNLRGAKRALAHLR